MRYFAMTAAVLAAAFCALAAAAQELELAETEQDPPEGLAEAIKAELQGTAIQLTNGGEAVFEFWFRKAIPVAEISEDSGAMLEGLEETTLIGAAKVHDQRRDYRDDEIYVDTYTVRFGIIPKDGNHLGAADYDYFAVLIPAGSDEAVDQFEGDADAMLEASLENTASFHPMIMSLRPAESADAEAPALNTPEAGKESVRVRVPAKAGEEEGELVFELVYKGTGHL